MAANAVVVATADVTKLLRNKADSPKRHIISKNIKKGVLKFKLKTPLNLYYIYLSKPLMSSSVNFEKNPFNSAISLAIPPITLLSKFIGITGS